MRIIQIVICLQLVAFLIACNKKGYLDTKPSTSVFMPNTPEDLQGLLDNPTVFGFGPYLNTISADEFFYSDHFIDDQSSEAKAYTWQDKIFSDKEEVWDWNGFYTQIYYCNIALEGVEKGLSNKVLINQYNLVRGDAYFKRAIAFYNLAQSFCRPYDTVTSDTDLGVPIRLTTDNQETLSRGTVKATYDQIISDLNKAIPLLPDKLNNKFRNRGSQPAAWAMLARTYLSMRDYQEAAQAAEQSRNLYDSLINFYELDPNIPIPFSPTNKETLYQMKMPAGNFIPAFLNGAAYINTNLISLYAPEDLRKTFFFSKSTPYIKSSFNGEIYPFCGLAIDEVYLILAESYIKLGQTALGIDVLNKLMITRWQKNKYFPYSESNADKARLIVLTERQKELLFRGQRWSDIRRLNKEGFKIDLIRTLNGTTYNLKYNEFDKFVLPLPGSVLAFGYKPNPR